MMRHVQASRRRFLVIATAASVACGSNGSREDAGNACESSHTDGGAKCCTGLDECGAGTSNFVKVEFCEHCPRRADDSICEAGFCRAVDVPLATGIDARFAIPEYALATKSWAIASFHPVMANGRHVACAELGSTVQVFENRLLNATQSTAKNIPDSVASLDKTYGHIISAEPGADRIVLMTLVDGPQGQGLALARGCTDAIEVREGEISRVEIVFHEP